MEKGQISGWQFFILIFGYLLGTTFFFRTGGLIALAKVDAWIIPLWAGAAGILFFFVWIMLANQYPGLTIVQICTQAAGKAMGGLIALLYIGYFVLLSALVIRNLGDFMKLSLMPRTPISVFHVMFLVIICYAVSKGIETIARATQILLPLVTLTFLFIFFVALSEWDWDRFQGMFRMDVWRTVSESRSLLGFPYMEAVVFLMLIPYVQNKQKASFILAIVSTTLLLSAIIFFTIGVLGITRASHQTYAWFLIVQEISIGTFFEHLESTIALVLLVAIFIKLSVAYYGAVLGMCQLFRVNDRSWITWSLLLLISGLALGLDNVLQNIELNQKYYFELMLVYAILLPLLLLCITWIKQWWRKRKAGAVS